MTLGAQPARPLKKQRRRPSPVRLEAKGLAGDILRMAMLVAGLALIIRYGW